MGISLKDYIIEYKKGNHDILNELIGTYKIVETNNIGSNDTVQRLHFKDNALNGIYWDICVNHHYIDYKILDHYIFKAFYDVRDDGSIVSIFDNVDVNMSPKQILSYIRVKLTGYVKNQIKANDDNTVSEWFDNPNPEDDEERELSRIDNVVFRTYQQIESKVNQFDEFREYIGGDIRNLLSKNQIRMYELLQDVEKTQQDIAKEYGCTQQNVADMTKAIHNRVLKAFVEWKALKNLKENKNTYRIIKGFMQQLETIKLYDTTNNFDYFGYVIDFLKSNYIENEQKITFKELHQNKKINSLSVIDVVVDRVNVDTYKIVDQYIFKVDTNLKLTKRKKESFVKDIIKAFEKYLNETEKAIRNLSKKVVDDSNNQKYIDLLR